MQTKTVLNNVDHHSLKVDTRAANSPELHVNRTIAYTPEIADLHKEFPLMFYREPVSGTLQLHAILGLDKDENLFVDENGWQSRFVPAQLACGPFSLVMSQATETPAQPYLCFDEHDARINETTGEPVFLPYGGESAYLTHVKKALQVAQAGATYDPTLLTLAEQMEVLEPVSIKINLSSEHQVSFNDYWCVSDKALAALDADKLQTLNQHGALGLLFFIASSMSNFQQLIDRKQSRSALIQPSMQTEP